MPQWRPGRDQRRTSSMTPHYQTFPTAPPKTKGRPPSNSPPPPSPCNDQNNNGEPASPHHGGTPLPKAQLVVLAIIALSEQTAFNSIGPYLPQMTASFPEVDPDEVGLYVGLIATCFALAQLVTNFYWGWLSDRIGRKPVILLGTLCTAVCFLGFGFCKNLWSAMLVQALMGTVNGNQGIVSTCLGEITDRSNQSKAFTYLPVIYGIGAVTGPAVGGILAGRFFEDFPYLAPNILSFAVLLVDLAISMVWLEESLEEAKTLPPLNKRVGDLFSWVWQFAAITARPSYLKALKQNHRVNNHAHHRSPTQNDHDDDSDDDTEEETDDESLASMPQLVPEHHTRVSAWQVLTRDTVLLLATYTIFQLSNVAYNSLYPIFAEAKPPTGRALSPADVGLSLSFAGLVTIVFQVGIFGKLRERIGNKATYRTGLAGFVLVFLMMPWVGYQDEANGDGGISSGKVWLWVELGFILLVKTIATIGGLTSALLLVTNSAPDHAVLGTLNGLAQTLSAAGRAIGPFVSGGLFTVATKVKPKGEAVAFGVFGGIAFIGFIMSFGIRSPNLEADPHEDESSDDDDADSDEMSPLMR